MSENTYWASEPSEKVVWKLSQKVDSYSENELTKGLFGRHTRAFQFFYGMDPIGIHATSKVLRGGDRGELAELRVNHSRSLVNALLNLIVAPKVIWTPKATNIDYDSIRECELAAAILEYYWTERKVAKYAIQALEEAIVFTEGFVHVPWDSKGGEEVSLDENGQMVRTGDATIRNVSTWDVIRDTTKASFEALDWVIVRVYQNKYNVAAQYPEFADLVMQSGEDNKFRGAPSVPFRRDTDDVPVYYFYHKSTAAMPYGRETVFLNNRTVLQDGVLTYNRIPLYRVAPAEMVSTPYAYSPFLEILGVQEVIDSLHTSIATNQTTLATQCIAIQQGSEIPIDQLAGGMKAIYYPPGASPPAPLQLTATPAEVFKYVEMLKNDQQLLFGLNSVVRGETPSGELSGSALALLQSQALQQSSTLQGNYVRFIEEMGSGLLDLLKQRLDYPRKVAIVGKASSYLVNDTEFTGQNLQRIHRVQVEIGNPLASQPSGRAEIANDLFQKGVIKTTEEYLQVLQTGRLEPLTKGLSDELLLIRGENESLARGEPVQALAIDDHLLHVREHRSVLANLEARRNPAVINAVLAHLDEHESLYYTVAPSKLIMMGQQPPQVPQGQPPPPPSPGGEGGGAPAVMEGPGNPTAESSNPQGARLPTNPATGQQWTPETGGGVVPPPVAGG